MKKISIIVALFFASLAVFSQSDTLVADSVFSLNEVTVSSGKGALTAGTYLDFDLSKNKYLLRTTISNDDIMLTAFYQKGKALLGVSGGYYFNIPWVGPQVITQPFPFLSTFHWVGWTWGRIGEEAIVSANSGFAFAVNSVTLHGGRFQASYCLIHYMTESPISAATLKYSQPLNSGFNVFTEVGWNLKTETQLLKLGVSYKK